MKWEFWGSHSGDWTFLADSVCSITSNTTVL